MLCLPPASWETQQSIQPPRGTVNTSPSFSHYQPSLQVLGAPQFIFTIWGLRLGQFSFLRLTRALNNKKMSWHSSQLWSTSVPHGWTRNGNTSLISKTVLLIFLGWGGCSWVRFVRDAHANYFTAPAHCSVKNIFRHLPSPATGAPNFARFPGIFNFLGSVYFWNWNKTTTPQITATTQTWLISH